MAEVRQAEMPRDRESVGQLWLDYLTWGNDGLEARHGFRLPVGETVEGDLAAVEKFQPPKGRLLLAVVNGEAVATASMQRIGPGTAEVKRMYVVPAHRRAGLGRELLDELITAARAGGCYARRWPGFTWYWLRGSRPHRVRPSRSSRG